MKANAKCVMSQCLGALGDGTYNVKDILINHDNEFAAIYRNNICMLDKTCTGPDDTPYLLIHRMCIHISSVVF